MLMLHDDVVGVGSWVLGCNVDDMGLHRIPFGLMGLHTVPMAGGNEGEGGSAEGQATARTPNSSREGRRKVER